MKITIYELLGLIKDGKQPKYISMDGAKLFWNGKTYQFETEYCTLNWDYYIEEIKLNDKVEIIEEDENPLEDMIDESLFEDKDIEEINKKIFEAIGTPVDEVLIDKINELVRALNKLKGKHE